MSLEQQQKDLEAYVSWKAEKEVMGNDTSPSAYVIDKAKQEAFERVVKAVDLLENYDSLWLGRGDEQAVLLQELNGILTGQRD